MTFSDKNQLHKDVLKILNNKVGKCKDELYYNNYLIKNRTVSNDIEQIDRICILDLTPFLYNDSKQYQL